MHPKRDSNIRSFIVHLPTIKKLEVTADIAIPTGWNYLTWVFQEFDDRREVGNLCREDPLFCSCNKFRLRSFVKLILSLSIQLCLGN